MWVLYVYMQFNNLNDAVGSIAQFFLCLCIHHTSNSTMTHLHCQPITSLLPFLNMSLSLVLVCSCCSYAVIPPTSPSLSSLCSFTSFIISSTSSSAFQQSHHHHRCLDSIGGFILLLVRADAPWSEKSACRVKDFLTRLKYHISYAVMNSFVSFTCLSLLK